MSESNCALAAAACAAVSDPLPALNPNDVYVEGIEASLASTAFCAVPPTIGTSGEPGASSADVPYRVLTPWMKADVAASKALASAVLPLTDAHPAAAGLTAQVDRSDCSCVRAAVSPPATAALAL